MPPQPQRFLTYQCLTWQPGLLCLPIHVSRHSSSMASVDDTVTNGVCVRHKGPLRLLQGLQLCRGAWGPGDPWDRHSAHAALWGRPPGSFLVVDDSSSQNKLLCVSVDGQDKTVLDFSILLTGTGEWHSHWTPSRVIDRGQALRDKALQLSTSRLTFCDLLQLVTFYTLSRDVLPLCLLVPSWVCSLTKQPSHLLPQLGPNLQPVVMTPGTTDSQDTVMCSIQTCPVVYTMCDTDLSCRMAGFVVGLLLFFTYCIFILHQLTTSSGALCIINPLYLHEHGDDWLTCTSASPQPASYPDLKRDRRMSTARPCVGAGLKKGGVSLDKPSNSSDQSVSILMYFMSPVGGAVQSPVSPVTTEGVVLRRSSCSTTPDPVRRESAESLGPVPQSPHRVSWVEDKFWLNPPPSPSLLQPPCLELDSLSISSIEEEPEAESPSQLQHLSRLPLADKVKNRLSAVGQALGSLMSPRRRLSKRVQELSERRGGAFAEAVRGFVEQMMKLSAVPSGISVDVLQDVRVSLTALKETLYDYTEIQSITDTLTELPDVELDALLELALHKVALKPIYTHLYVGMKTARQADGSLRRLEANRDTLAGHSLEELEGTAGAGVPDAITMEKIQQHWNTMHQAYSPSKKVDTLLKVCKNVYHSMSANVRPGVVFGADDFLPCLTWVLVRSDVATLQTDTDYMMELLDPSQLQGESGYYLTSLYAALFYISSYRPRLAARHLSAEAHKSLNQWHRRRTLHCNQSRRSRNRRTIRRHGRGEGPSKSNKEAGESSSNESGESGEPQRSLAGASMLCRGRRAGAPRHLLTDHCPDTSSPITAPTPPHRSLPRHLHRSLPRHLLTDHCLRNILTDHCPFSPITALTPPPITAPTPPLITACNTSSPITAPTPPPITASDTSSPITASDTSSPITTPPLQSLPQHLHRSLSRHLLTNHCPNSSTDHCIRHLFTDHCL
ncbi:hypothetical protein P4O66_013973 [Electrophorus voltai]|uniref:VPS9 domain-containing protein n=1 Tax=Electrophorus voltai TaxID=2609070 RepID=A0AAD8YZC9_9TELE|nr:hypothetical protein P4O66_013973 [Electrophorus voltai]